MKGQAFVTLAAEEQAVKAVRDTNAFVLKGKPMAVVSLNKSFLPFLPFLYQIILNEYCTLKMNSFKY